MSARLCRLSVYPRSRSLLLNNSAFLWACTLGCCQPLLLICTRWILISLLPFFFPRVMISHLLSPLPLWPPSSFSLRISVLSLFPSLGSIRFSFFLLCKSKWEKEELFSVWLLPMKRIMKWSWNDAENKDVGSPAILGKLSHFLHKKWFLCFLQLYRSFWKKTIQKIHQVGRCFHSDVLWGICIEKNMLCFVFKNLFF